MTGIPLTMRRVYLKPRPGPRATGSMHLLRKASFLVASSLGSLPPWERVYEGVKARRMGATGHLRSICHTSLGGVQG